MFAFPKREDVTYDIHINVAFLIALLFIVFYFVFIGRGELPDINSSEMITAAMGAA